MNKKVPATNKPPSKFPPLTEDKEVLEYEQIMNMLDIYWTQQGIELHNCYRKGAAYANNNNKKTSIDLLQDMMTLLNNQFKDTNQSPEILDILTGNIKSCLSIISKLDIDVDKNCILSTILGYTLKCFKKYESK